MAPKTKQTNKNVVNAMYSGGLAGQDSEHLCVLSHSSR